MGNKNWYDLALYYDVLFGWDPATERDFLLGASEGYGLGRPTRSLEPFCGTGRLLRAMPGAALGLDLNPAMVRFAQQQGGKVFLADAARFAVAPASVELGYCLIDSFRHLLREEEARAHLLCMAEAIRPGGLYVLGLDLSSGLAQLDSREEWDGSRGQVRVKGLVEGIGDADPVRRLETMRVVLEVKDGRQRHRIESHQPLRTYSAAQLRELVEGVASFRLVESFDRRYQLNQPRSLESIEGSAVIVLQRTP